LSFDGTIICLGKGKAKLIDAQTDKEVEVGN